MPVVYVPQFLDDGEAARLHRALLSAVSWEEREIVLFGKRIRQPRLVAWASPLPYRYSGQTLPPRAVPAVLEPILARVCERAGATFNHVLMNRYRDGNDSMGMHSDDEPELGTEPTVASLSLGAARRFVMAKKKGRGARTQYLLEHGSLLVMSGDSQATHRHGIPKDPSATGERVSLTFRRVFA